MKSKWLLSTLSILTVLAGCENEPVVVGENTQALEISKVDILLVVDDSNSVQGLQTELPALLDSFIEGSDEPGHERPKLTDIHLGVVSTDMGLSQTEMDYGIDGCHGLGNDGEFLELTSEDIAQCEPETSNFVSYEDGTATITTELAASCVPEVGTEGCGFEQPLEAMLKALSTSDGGVHFVEGEGHGDGENSGFLREDSLLVVVVVTDEDDCSTPDPTIFDPMAAQGDAIGLNLLCAARKDDLYDIGRYVEGLKALREADGDPIVFVALSAIPPELVDEAAQGAVDFGDSAAVDAYYDSVLDDPRMQLTVNTHGNEEYADDFLFPSCDRGEATTGYPSPRLVEVAKSFGKAGVLGSICAENFASTIGGVIRATAESLD